MSPPVREIDRSLNGLNDRLAKLGWPEGDDGNGNGHGNNNNDNNKIKEWKGKPVIRVHEWEEIAGLAEVWTKTEEIQRAVAQHANPQVRDDYMMLGRLPDWAEKELEEIKHEIRPEALDSFPDNLVFSVFGPLYSYSHPQQVEPDINTFNQWKQDYTELLEKTGMLDNGERITWYVNGQTVVCSENRAIVNGLYFTADNSNYKF